jgi:uncharacterized protein YwgA
MASQPRLGRLLAQAPGYAPGRFSSLCADIGAVEPAELERAWRALRRRLSAPELARLRRRVSRFEITGAGRLGQRADLLLLLLGARDAAGQPNRGISGTTRILKLAFIALKEAGAAALPVPQYAFVPFRFGPFTAAVYDDLQNLIDAGLVRRDELGDDGEPVILRDEGIDEGFTFNGLRTHYRLTEKGARFAAALAQAAKNKHPAAAAGIEIVKAHFAPLPLRDLLRYTYTRWPAFATHSEILDEVLAPQEPHD